MRGQRLKVREGPLGYKRGFARLFYERAHTRTYIYARTHSHILTYSFAYLFVYHLFNY